MPSRPVRQAPPSPLDPGDTIEESVSASVKTGGSEVWVKVGATCKVRAGESADQAEARLNQFLNEKITERVNDIVNA